jgi:heme exporter protein D
MYLRPVYSLSISVLLTFLHIGCCVLPFLSIISVSVAHTGFLSKYQDVFEVLQWLVMVSLSGRLVAFHFFGRNFHNRLEMYSYYISLVITVAGLVINYMEPFKTEKQVLAEAHFERFRQHRQLNIELIGYADENQLRKDLQDIEGIKRVSVNLDMLAVQVSYQNDRITPPEIFEVLREKGYVLKDMHLR